MREPAFWWENAGRAARLLAPIAACYGAIARSRLNNRGFRASLPVVCVGNLTVGGAGKTPTALALARVLAAAGERPVFLSRGYGGALAGPVVVDPAAHRAADVGDEPLLLAQSAPTIVARARVAGAKAATAAAASVIVMDDGFQNSSLHKDLCLLVIDARRGIGNGRVIPAGPLRAPLAAQMAHAHAMIMVGTPLAGGEPQAHARARNIPIFPARLQPDPGFTAALGRGRVLAFAGIGDPQKFFATLAEAGVAVARTASFPDHHRYTRDEAQALLADADRDGLILVTTEKDMARLAGEPELTELACHSHALPITLVFEEADKLRSMLLERLASARKT